jgi:hypothetical protein
MPLPRRGGSWRAPDHGLADINTTAPAQLEGLQREARARNLELFIQRVDKAGEISAAIDAV